MVMVHSENDYILIFSRFFIIGLCQVVSEDQVRSFLVQVSVGSGLDPHFEFFSGVESHYEHTGFVGLKAFVVAHSIQNCLDFSVTIGAEQLVKTVFCDAFSYMGDIVELRV